MPEEVEIRSMPMPMPMPMLPLLAMPGLRRKPAAPVAEAQPRRENLQVFLRTLLACLLSASLLGVAQLAVAADETSDPESVDVVFVLDNSGSMRQNDPQYLTRQAVSNFASNLSQAEGITARIGVVLFDGTARLIQPLASISNNTGNPPETLLDDAMNALDFSGQRTNSPAGIERALYELRENGQAKGRRAIVFLSDGKIDTGDPQTDYDASWWLREELAEESRTLGVRIFSIAFTDAADYQLMQAIAQKTRASYYRAYQADQLDNVVTDIVGKVAKGDFYALTSAETNSAPPSRSNSPSNNTAAASADLASLPDETPLAPDSSTGFLAWLPLAALLIAGVLLWRSRKPGESVDALIAQAELDMDAPAAQLLDFGGQLGETGTALPLKRGRNRIGRDKHNDLILDDDAISSEHAIIEVHDGRYWIEDRRSTNGTRIGDQRIAPEQRVPLKGGDHIRFAGIDLMFVLAGYVPGGATAFLDTSTNPPLGWRERKQSALPPSSTAPPVEKPVPADPAPPSSIDVPPPESDIAIASKRERTDPAPVENLDDSLGGLVQEAAPTDPYRECLDFHLARVEEISPAFEQFVDDAFDIEIRDALAISARELIESTRQPENAALESKDYTKGTIRYVVCGLSGEMEAARGCYVEAFGGFTRMLTEHLQSESFRRDGCEVLAVLTFGQPPTPEPTSGSTSSSTSSSTHASTSGTGKEATPWVSLSIVPDEGQDLGIDLLSYEFLTAEERSEIEPTGYPETGASNDHPNPGSE